MNDLFARMMSRLSLFWRNFLLLSTVVILFLSAFSFAVRQFSRSLRSSYLDQAQSTFSRNCQDFSRELFLTLSLPPALESRDSYSVATDAESPLEASTTVSFVSMRSAFSAQCALLDMPSECFLIFERSQACLTRGRFFRAADDCFSSHLIYEDPDTFRAALLQRDRLGAPRLLPAQDVSMDGSAPAPYLTLLISSSSSRDIYGFLYSAAAVEEHFHLSAFPASSYFRLIHTDGTELFSHGTVTEDGFARLTASIPSLSCTAVLGIPHSHFDQTIQRAMIAPLIVFLLCLIVGIALCFIFSHISVTPFRRLIQDHDMVGEDTTENELVTIDTFLRSAQQRALALDNMLLSSLLVRAFSGLPIREDEYQALSVAFPQFQQPRRTAVIRDRCAGSVQEDTPSMVSLLQDALPEHFMCEYINLDEALVVLPAESDALDLLQSLLPALGTKAGAEPRFVCGVSAPFIGLSELSASIRQAQFCVPADTDRVVITYSADAVDADLSADRSVFDLKQFQQALATWNQREMLVMIDRLCSHPGSHPEETFYSILFLLRDTAHTGNMSFASHEKVTWLSSGTAAANFQQLTDIVNELFLQKSALQLSDRQQLCQQLVQHIRDNFADPTLCLFSLARQFGVSERFAHNAIQSITGQNFSSFLSVCRMQEAARLLRETDISINEVAERCGYPAISTFYRNFKKHHLMAPAEYKDSLQ